MVFAMAVGLIFAAISFMFTLVVFSNITSGCTENCEETGSNVWTVVGLVPPGVFAITFFVLYHIMDKREEMELSKYR